MNEWPALLIASLGGAAMGLIHGFFFAKVGVPAFVVTLAGNLARNGLMLQVLGSSGTVNSPSDSGVADLYGRRHRPTDGRRRAHGRSGRGGRCHRLRRMRGAPCRCPPPELRWVSGTGGCCRSPR